MSQAYLLRSTPPVPGRLIITCPCGDGINTPNTPAGARLVDGFRAAHECEKQS